MSECPIDDCFATLADGQKACRAHGHKYRSQLRRLRNVKSSGDETLQSRIDLTGSPRQQLNWWGQAYHRSEGSADPPSEQSE